MSLLCKDCKHFKPDASRWGFLLFGWGKQFARCTHDLAIKEWSESKYSDGFDLGLVDGIVRHKPDYYFCMSMRKPQFECGLAGKLWEPRDE